jgi:hypothetical protein
LKEFTDVFEGTGKYHLELDENATLIVHPPRKVPVAIKERLRNELERLTKMDIIKPVSTPTPWVSSLVIVVKPGKLRICIDQKHLNQNIKRSHYPLPTIEDLLPDLSKAKIFCVVDAKNGFWHVELDDESSYLTTFNTRLDAIIGSGCPLAFHRLQRSTREDRIKLLKDYQVSAVLLMTF